MSDKSSVETCVNVELDVPDVLTSFHGPSFLTYEDGSSNGTVRNITFIHCGTLNPFTRFDEEMYTRGVLQNYFIR